MQQQPRYADLFCLRRNTLNRFTEVCHVDGGKRAFWIFPHASGLWRFLAKLGLGKCLGVNHAGERNQGINALVLGGLNDSDRSPHAVADVANIWVAGADCCNHGIEVSHFFGDRGITEVTTGRTIASEGEPEGVKAGLVECSSGVGDERAIFVSGNTVTENDDPASAQQCRLTWAKGIV